MDDPAVVASLVLGKTRLFFHQKDTRERMAAAKSGAGRETNNSSTDYCEIIHTLPLKSLCLTAGWIEINGDNLR